MRNIKIKIEIDKFCSSVGGSRKVCHLKTIGPQMD